VTSEVFLDTSFVIASISGRDQYHLRAQALDNELRSQKTRITTTTSVLLEVGNSLAKPRTRASAAQAIEFLLHDPTVAIIQLNDERLARALELYRRRADKEWGLVDCLSFVVMWDRGLTEALTSDEHFEQAGFVALLRQ
jgi:predicted nucleic acid-binding protein